MATNVSVQINLELVATGAKLKTTSATITGEAMQNIESTIATGDTETISGATFEKAKAEVIYLLSDNADCVVVFTNAGGNTTINLVAGEPYLWYADSGQANPLAHDVTTMTVENNGTQAVDTDFHARILLAA